MTDPLLFKSRFLLRSLLSYLLRVARALLFSLAEAREEFMASGRIKIDFFSFAG